MACSKTLLILSVKTPISSACCTKGGELDGDGVAGVAAEARHLYGQLPGSKHRKVLNPSTWT